MNILVLHSSSDLYGASKILLQTVSYLLKKGHKIIVIVSEEGPLPDLLRKEGCEVYIIKLGTLRRKYFTPSGIINRVSAIKKAIKGIGKIALNRDIDIIYSNTTTVLAGAFLAKRMNIRHVWHIHEIITQKWLMKVIGWVVNRYSDKAIVVSNAVKKYWQDYVDENKIAVVYNGLDYQKYLHADGSLLRSELGLSAEDLLIGMIGRVHPWKGQTYFLNIAKHVLNGYPNVKFIMVGDVFPGNEYLYDEIRKTISDLSIQEQVIDLGYRNDIPKILSALDIFVLPSVLPDPLPTVVLEAMAAAIPVVATAHGGSTEMVLDQVTGYLIPWDDASKAASVILKLTSSKTLREEMGSRGRDRVQSMFSGDAYFRNIEQVIFSNPDIQTRLSYTGATKGIV
jgi:glycosyltransferase involved in cell wall biosynthesis